MTSSGSGSSNIIAIGEGAAASNTTGFDYTAIGVANLGSLTDGGDHVSIGNYALGSCTSCTGFSVVGYNGFSDNVTGVDGAGVGYDVLANSLGSRNSALGESAGRGLVNGNNFLFLGNESGGSITGGHNTIVIGRPNISGSVSDHILLATGGPVGGGDGFGQERLRINASGAWSFNAGSSYGTSGYFLVTNGNAAAPSWSTTLPTSAIPTLQQVITAGALMTQDNVVSLATFDFGFANNLGEQLFIIKSPEERVTVNAGFAWRRNPFSVSTLLQTANLYAAIDASGGARTITLPDANGNTGQLYIIKKLDNSANTVTIQGTGGDPIDGEANFVLTDSSAYVWVISNDTDWEIIGNSSMTGGGGATPTWQQTLTAGDALTTNVTATLPTANYFEIASGNSYWNFAHEFTQFYLNTAANGDAYTDWISNGGGSRVQIGVDNGSANNYADIHVGQLIGGANYILLENSFGVADARYYNSYRIDSSGMLFKPHLGGFRIDTLLTFSDTTDWKPLVYKTSTGEVKKATYWPGGGGGGAVTDFIFTDGNGFDGTVTNSTTTPTLSLTTTVSNTQVMFSNSGAITGDAGMVYSTANDRLTLIGNIDGSANGVVYVQGTGTGNLGSGISLSASNESGGRVKTIFSAGTTSSAGVGSLAVYDLTAGYQMVITGSGEMRVGPSADTDAGDITFQARGTGWFLGGIAVNDGGSDSDTRIEGDTEVNLFFVDASADRIGIGTSSPQAQFHTTGSVRLAGIGGEGFVISDADGDLSVTASTTLLDEGSYTPTLTNTTNINASTAYTTYWYKVKNRVYVFGEVDIDATATGAVELRMSMPVDWPGSSWTNTYELAGTSVCGATGVASQIRGHVASGTASFTFVATTTTNDRYSFHFSYVVNAP